MNRKLRIFFPERSSMRGPDEGGGLEKSVVGWRTKECREAGGDSHEERDFWEVVLPVAGYKVTRLKHWLCVYASGLCECLGRACKFFVCLVSLRICSKFGRKMGGESPEARVLPKGKRAFLKTQKIRTCVLLQGSCPDGRLSEIRGLVKVAQYPECWPAWRLQCEYCSNEVDSIWDGKSWGGQEARACLARN